MNSYFKSAKWFWTTIPEEFGTRSSVEPNLRNLQQKWITEQFCHSCWCNCEIEVLYPDRHNHLLVPMLSLRTWSINFSNCQYHSVRIPLLDHDLTSVTTKKSTRQAYYSTAQIVKYTIQQADQLYLFSESKVKEETFLWILSPFPSGITNRVAYKKNNKYSSCQEMDLFLTSGTAGSNLLNFVTRWSLTRWMTTKISTEHKQEKSNSLLSRHQDL